MKRLPEKVRDEVETDLRADIAACCPKAQGMRKGKPVPSGMPLEIPPSWLKNREESHGI